MRLAMIALFISQLLVPDAPKSVTLTPSLRTIVTGATTAARGAVDDPSGSSLGIAFPGDSLELNLFLSGISETNGPGELILAPGWWKALVVEFQAIDNTTLPAAATRRIPAEELIVQETGFSSKEIPLRSPMTIRQGEFASAKLIVPAPPPGDYWLNILFSRSDIGSAQSTPGMLSVREGHENDAVRRTWLRYKIRRTQSFREFKALEIELASLEPTNWIPWEELADRSLREAPAEETASYYDRAYELFTRAVESGAVPFSPEKARAQQTFLKLFKEIQPSYAAQRDRFVLEPIWDKDVKTFKVVDRKTGRTVATLDPMRPSIPKERL
jgi:hypothetical protein